MSEQPENRRVGSFQQFQSLRDDFVLEWRIISFTERKT